MRAGDLGHLAQRGTGRPCRRAARHRRRRRRPAPARPWPAPCPASGRSRLRPFHAVERDDAGLALLARRRRRARAPGCRPIRGRWSPTSSTTASRHGAMSASALTSASLRAPVAGQCRACWTGAAIALLLVEAARGRRPAPCAPAPAAWDRAWCAPRGRPRRASSRRSFSLMLAADFLGEIFGREDVRRRSAAA